MSGEPFPKSQQLARGERRYRRKVASPKQWQAIIGAKGDLCRLRLAKGHNCSGPIQYHHLVPRTAPYFGDDVPENIVPLCERAHGFITNRSRVFGRLLASYLSDAEYAYAVQKVGEDVFERCYGVTYARA